MYSGKQGVIQNYINLKNLNKEDLERPLIARSKYSDFLAKLGFDFCGKSGKLTLIHNGCSLKTSTKATKY